MFGVNIVVVEVNMRDVEVNIAVDANPVIAGEVKQSGPDTP
jgi:hypothetical protein